MIKCEYCDKELSTTRGLTSHYVQVHSPARIIKDRSGSNNPRFGRKGSNQFTNLDWDTIPWDKLSLSKRRQILIEEANHSCTKCGFNERRACGGCILEVDHIDGNHRNNTRANLQVLCPNCHALTPNFRNWDRSTKNKTSTRVRKGNKNFEIVRNTLKQKEYVEHFVRTVHELFETKEIDFMKFGWTVKLAEKLKDPNPSGVRNRVKRLMPTFFLENCRINSRKRL